MIKQYCHNKNHKGGDISSGGSEGGGDGDDGGGGSGGGGEGKSPNTGPRPYCRHLPS